MGLRTFWVLLVLIGVVSYFSQRHGSRTPPAFYPGEENNRTVVEIKKDPSETPAAPTPAAPTASHLKAVAPKPAVVVEPDAGGTVEQEASPRLVRFNTGDLVVDRYWSIHGGNGSPDAPYRLSWDLLLSVQEEYKAHPELPDRVKFLSDKNVIITGTVQSSANGTADEFVMMDQKMDNCPACVARSIFATIHVKVTKPENLEHSALHILTVRGRFKAAPTVDSGSGYLLGVYYLDDGEIIARSSN